MVDLLFTFGLLFFVFFLPLFVIGFAPDRPWRRTRTAREDALHDQIQRAMNWSPEHFTLQKDGKYRNAYGVEGVRISLDEFMKGIEDKD